MTHSLYLYGRLYKRLYKCLVIASVILFLGSANPGLYPQIEPGAKTGMETGTKAAEKSLLVMPFKVNPAEEKANQWLGRAVSYYLIAGLQANDLNVMPDIYTTAILEMNHILFPYSVTKAGIMRLARKYRLNYAIWGEITLEKIESQGNGNSPDDGNTPAAAAAPQKDENPGKDEPPAENETSEADNSETVENNRFQVQLKGFIIDLDNYSQKYLPVIKGHINDLYKIQDELLSSVVQSLTPPAPDQQTRYPRFDLNHRNYELFIKSLLSKDNARRIQLLEKVRNASAGEESDLLNFELAALSFDSGDLDAAGALLEKIPADKDNPQPLFRYKQEFLKGLIAYARENIPAAVEAFTLLRREGRYPFEVQHNLGVIHFKQKDYKTAQSYFQQALAERKDPATWLYLIYALLFENEPRLAELQLNQALRMYPQEEKPVQLLAYFISQSQDKDVLFSAFQSYIPNFFLNENLPGVTLRLKNPFRLQLSKAFSAEEPGDPDESADASPNEDIDSAIERLQGLLEMNPFEPGHYRAIAQFYLKKKEYRQAELHGVALVFLENTEANTLLLAKIYKAMGNKKKAKEIKKRTTTQ